MDRNLEARLGGNSPPFLPLESEPGSFVDCVRRAAGGAGIVGRGIIFRLGEPLGLGHQVSRRHS